MPALYNDILIKSLMNNLGLAKILSGVNAGAGSVATAAHGGVIFLYHGTPPATVAQLDASLASLSAGNNTLLAAILANVGSNYGVTFATPTGAPPVLGKAGGETWGTGTLALSAWPHGALTTTNNLTMDYAIFASLDAGDDGFSVNPGTWPRALLTVGIAGAGVYDVNVGNNVLSWTGSETLSSYQFQQ